MTTNTELLTLYSRDGMPHIVAGETPKAYLERCDLLERGFYYEELVKKSMWGGYQRKFGLPNHPQLYRLGMTLALANVFRERAMAEAGIKGCGVNAAVRMSGGAKNSQHKSGSAIDLDPKGGDKVEYGRCAVRLWSELGIPLSIGLGLYVYGRSSRSVNRVHLDTDWRCRSWQGVVLGLSPFARPYQILGTDGRQHMLGLPCKIATELGLDVPSLEYL